MKQIVASVGDFYHNEDLTKEALETALHPLLANNGAKLAYVDAEQLGEILPSDPDAVVLFKENRVNPEDAHVEQWMDDKVSEGIGQYVKNGGSWLAWHSGLASYPVDSAYVNMLRGYFEHHPDQNKAVRYIPPQPFNEELPDCHFRFVDEHYFVHCREAETEVFLRSESEDGSSTAGWRHAFGKGKVCCLAPAHRREGLLDPAFVRLLRHQLEWCLRK